MAQDEGATGGEEQSGSDDAPPTSSTDEEAHALFVAGRAAFDEARYDEALARFEAAYERSGRPELLFNVALAAERSGQAALALDSYRRFLDALPDARNRGDVEMRIAALQERLDQESRPADAAEEVTGAAGGRLWTWVASGTAVLLVAGGSVAWFSARSRYESHRDECGGTPGGCTPEQIREVTGTLTLSRVLFGVGAAATAAAIVLFIVEPGWGSDAQLEVAVGPAGIVVGGRM